MNSREDRVGWFSHPGPAGRAVPAGDCLGQGDVIRGDFLRDFARGPGSDLEPLRARLAGLGVREIRGNFLRDFAGGGNAFEAAHLNPIEFLLHDGSLSVGAYLPQESFNPTARLNTGFAPCT